MDRREEHQQHKEKERAQKKKDEHAYEEASEKRRLPVNSVVFVVVGVVLTAIVIYVWTFQLW